MDMTRRNFVGSLAATMAIPAIGKNDDWFEDIRVDRYYVLHGGQYGDTGGWGQPGYMEGPELIIQMKDWVHCRELEDKLDIVEECGFYLTPSQYLGAPWREFDRIYLTKDWMLEFYMRHKDEPLKSWELRYDRYLNDVNSGKYSTKNIY